MILLRLLVPVWLRALLLTNLGGLVLLALVAATESADDPLSVLFARLRADVPHTWALLSPRSRWPAARSR